MPLVKALIMARAIRDRLSFWGVSYSPVSKANTRFSEKLEKDREIKRDVQITGNLSQVKA